MLALVPPFLLTTRSKCTLGDSLLPRFSLAQAVAVNTAGICEPWSVNAPLWC